MPAPSKRNLILPLAFFAGLALSGSAAEAQGQDPAAEPSLDSLYFSETEVVEGATHFPKPLFQVAENVTIVTAKEIENMNAHTVAEVLNRVAGVFVYFQGQDFGSPASLSIQGSIYEHILLLVDGMRWNYSGGFPQTLTIPVRIIDRIEVIKGPASSTWGSALGGVINIITKGGTIVDGASGALYTSVGENETIDYNGEVRGRADWLGYYLYAGGQDSDGLYNDRFFENKTGYAKFRCDLPANKTFTLTAGYSSPYNQIFAGELSSLSGSGSPHLVDPLEVWQDRRRTSFVTASFDTLLGQWLSWNVSLNSLQSKVIQYTDDYLTTGKFSTAKIFDENRLGANTRLLWSPKGHNVVLGADIDQGEADITYEFFPIFQPASSSTDLIPDDNNWGVYINDTIALGNFFLTPGIRYDHNSASSDELDPSLGLTYRLTDDTLLRGLVARGYRKADEMLTLDNPGLDNETVWSMQAGVETTAIRFLRLKTSIFHHLASDVWVPDPSLGWINGGESRRTGFEVEAETVAIYYLTLAANFTCVYEAADDYGNEDQYSANLILRYDNPEYLYAEIAGHYVQWNEHESSPEDNGKFDDVIWDLNLNREMARWESTRLIAFLTGHNLLNGEQYTMEVLFHNPGRWVEAGLRVRF